MANEQIKGIKVNGVSYDLNLSEIVSHLTSPDGTDYVLKVDNEGNLYAHKDSSIQPINPPAGGESTTAITPSSVNKLYINSLYCGGLDANEHTVNYCSHNFVELSNLTNADINLDGMSLQYAIKETAWYVLPLKGVIKAGSTFLIRGAQCSALGSAKIKVNSYDMQWYVNDELIKFSTESAKFYLCFGTTAFNSAQPWIAGTTPAVPVGYIDLVGINGSATVDGYEKSPYPGGELNKRLFKKYYAMDPVSQATKDVSARDNSKWINYVDLTKRSGEVIPSIEDFTPKASYENKDIFYDKTKLFDGKPSQINCSFGIQATDNGEGATRCFNWLTKGPADDEFIWIKSKGASSWGAGYESFKSETGIRAYYNRKTVEYSDGTVITAHKFIKKNLAAGEYEYVAGYANQDGTPNLDACTPVYSFKVRSNADVASGFTFVQTSDQQGFNWDEYEVWKAAAKVIEKEDTNHEINFMINTGDMTQNGNRMGEWLDYFNAESDQMKNMEEMATIGNNDLSPKNLYALGNGSDASKLSLENIEFFYCFEMDETNAPVFTVNGVQYYIPSLYSFNYGKVHFLCMNSEIKAIAEQRGGVYDFDDYGNFYPLIKQWAETDIANSSSSTWNIAYCHEMPFTIITTGVTSDVTKNKETYEGGAGRGGSSLNTNIAVNDRYWFSEFCQTHNIPLVIGGHKHTQATSWPLLENVNYDGATRTVKSFSPIIVLHADNLENELAEFDNSTSLQTSTDGKKYPNAWLNGDGSINLTYSSKTALCEFKLDTELSEGTNPVIYAMSQATSYKHTSNKEVPSIGIPWLRYYYPSTSNGTKAAAGQKFPFYTLWKITDNKIEGHVRKAYGVFNGGGNFDINIDGQYTEKGYCSTNNEHNIELHSINGLSANVAADANTIIEIVK